MWKRVQRVSIESERMPPEVFVLADASDDRDDETLEEMDDEEDLFEPVDEEEGSTLADVSESASEASGSASKASDRVSEAFEAVSDATEGVSEASESKARELEQIDEEEEDDGEEVELSWAQEKYVDLKETVGVAMDRVPGPRVASSNMPWLVAVPLSYLVITLIFSVAKVIQKKSTPRAKRSRQVNRNKELNELITEYLKKDRSKLDPKGFRQLQSNFKFSAHEVLRKYIRFALAELPFNPELVSNLLLLRKSSGLSDKEVVGILNDISMRIVKTKGPVMMDTRGLTEKGIKKKAAVQAIFTKLLYLSELDEFLSPDARIMPERKPPPPTAVEAAPSKDEPLVFRPEMLKKQATGPSEEELEAERNQYLRIKEIFGLTDEDADAIRIETLSENDVSRLEAMLGRSASSSPDSSEGPEGGDGPEEGEEEIPDEDS